MFHQAVVWMFFSIVKAGYGGFVAKDSTNGLLVGWLFVSG